jgi:hypothetical protein
LLQRLAGFALATGLVAMALSSCRSATSSPREEGQARVRIVVAAQSASQIDHMTLTIGVDATSGPPSFLEIVAPLTLGDGKLSWGAYVTGIPAGTRRLLSVQGFDASSNVLFHGSAYADIVAGEAATVSLLLQGNGGGGYSNQSPVVDSLTSSAGSVRTGETVRVGVSAHADPGSTLSYMWSASPAGCGTFSDAHDPSPTWTAPPLVPPSGTCNLQVQVTANLSSVSEAIPELVYALPTVEKVGPSGGTVSSDTGVTLVVPAGALSALTTITVTQLVVPPPPEAGGVASPVFEFGPPGTQFQAPVTITLPVPTGLDGASAVIYWSDSTGNYQPLITTYDPATNTVSAQVTHFSLGYVGQGDYCQAHPGNACTSATPCRAATCQSGACVDSGTVPDGTACEDGNSCTRGDTCQQGTCVAGATVCIIGGDADVSLYPNAWP